jgi:hypothetical protein
MRTPVVKRQTSPKSGVLRFSASKVWRGYPLATCSGCISGCWCTNVPAPHTSCGSTASERAVTENVGIVLCALATSLYPHAVLFKRRAAPLGAPVRLRFGGGAAHGHPQGPSRPIQEREQTSTQPRRVRAKRLCAHGRSSTPGGHRFGARWPGGAQGDPVRPQAHLLCSLAMATGVQIEHYPPS